MRGFWFTMEAVIAGVILVTFLSFLATESPPLSSDLSPLAYRTLEGLAKQGILKPNAVGRNHTLINENVKIFDVSHAVQICGLDSCTGSLPTGSDVSVGMYITPGSGSYDPQVVKLYLYR